MVGYVLTDLLNSTYIQLKTEINNAVAFNMNFNGSGRFDIKIRNAGNEILFEQDNLRGQQGLNTYLWNGRNSSGVEAADGLYTLSIIPYKDFTPKAAVDLEFAKAGKVESASSTAYIFEDEVQYVNIPITFKADGILNVQVIYGETAYDLVVNEAVTAGQMKEYRIDKSMYDFNGKDLDKLEIKIDVR